MELRQRARDHSAGYPQALALKLTKVGETTLRPEGLCVSFEPMSRAMWWSTTSRGRFSAASGVQSLQQGPDSRLRLFFGFWARLGTSSGLRR